MHKYHMQNKYIQSHDQRFIVSFIVAKGFEGFREDIDIV